MTTADNVAQRPGAARENPLARHPLFFFFFLIAYAFMAFSLLLQSHC
jgi:hypothetical protein